MTEPRENGNGVDRHRCAVVTITLDMTTGLADIRGSVPTEELGKALCQMGADEFERRIQKKRTQAALTLAAPEFLQHLKGG